MTTVTVQFESQPNGEVRFDLKADDGNGTFGEQIIARHVFEICQQFLNAVEAEGDAVPTKQNA